GEDGEVYLRRKGDGGSAGSGDGGQGNEVVGAAAGEGPAGFEAPACAAAEESNPGELPQQRTTCRAMGGRAALERARGLRLLVSGAGTEPVGSASPLGDSGRGQASAASSRVGVPGRWSHGYGASCREQRRRRQLQRPSMVRAVGALGGGLRVVRVGRVATTQLHAVRRLVQI
ncbi:hypothetical protein Vretifemale_20853, partial [Volvox reticuliferus]